MERSPIIKAFEEANGEPLGPRQIAEAAGMKAVGPRLTGQVAGCAKHQDLAPRRRRKSR